MYEILKFIEHRWPYDSHWLDGNCYWFAAILKSRFPFLEIYYLPIVGHFVCGDAESNLFFDWSGQVILEEEPIKFETIQKEDPLWYDRIVRDCIL